MWCGGRTFQILEAGVRGLATTVVLCSAEKRSALRAGWAAAGDAPSLSLVVPGNSCGYSSCHFRFLETTGHCAQLLTGMRVVSPSPQLTALLPCASCLLTPCKPETPEIGACCRGNPPD